MGKKAKLLKMRKSFVLAIIILFAQLTHAYEISEINITIGEDGYTQIDQNIQVESEGEKATIPIPEYAEQIKVNDRLGRLEYNTTKVNGQNLLRIYFRKYQEEGESEKITVSYASHYLTKKDDGIWKIYFDSQATARKTIVRVKYPQESQIVTLKPENLLRTYVENGIWLFPQEDELNFSSTYRYQGVKPQITTTTQKKGGEGGIQIDARLLYGIGLLVLAAVLAAILVILYKNRMFSLGKRKDMMTVSVGESVVAEPNMVEGKVSYDIEGSDAQKGKKAVKESILKMLDDNELAIIKLMENSEEEEVTQAYIYKTTGIPKSSLSDILKRLEKRNIINRRVQGRVKWISIKSWALD